MKDKKKFLLSIGLVLILVLMIVGISYAAFKFTGTGKKENTITTGAITMKYTESTNTISMNNALPTTDATGKVRLTEGEYFDFTLEGTIKGSESINWEIAAEDVTTATKKIDGKYIKLYLTSIDENNNETEVMKPTVYTTEKAENTYTGRPTNMMSLAKGTTSTSFSTKYRLRMYVDESYNPQGDGGNLAFSIKINVYGKTGDKIPEPTAAEVLVAKANAEDLDYNSATDAQKKEMWTFSHEATEQTTALTDYRYIGADPNNYVKFNDELWRIIGVFDTDDGTGKVGLMYLSDYGYATSGGATTNRASCLAKELTKWDDSSVSDCKDNDWMYNSSKSQWTITPKFNTNGVFYVDNTGYVSSNIVYGDCGVRPVVHLNSAIKVISGSGTKESPYILE